MFNSFSYDVFFNSPPDYSIPDPRYDVDSLYQLAGSGLTYQSGTWHQSQITVSPSDIYPPTDHSFSPGPLSTFLPSLPSSPDTSSDSNDTDDGEYVPPASAARRKRRNNPRKPYCRATSSVSTSSSSSVSSASSTGRVRSSPPSRNGYLDAAKSTEVANMLKIRSAVGNDFICPCGYVQKNRRMPDFKRHLRTHMSSKEWCCKGVLREQAASFNVPEDSPSYLFMGRERVGGCKLTFSRRDALKRHLDNGGCFGNVSCSTED